MHLLIKQRGAGHENDNFVGLKLAKNTCVAPGAALHLIGPPNSQFGEKKNTLFFRIAG